MGSESVTDSDDLLEAAVAVVYGDADPGEYYRGVRERAQSRVVEEAWRTRR